jgi:hypothetical protein
VGALPRGPERRGPRIVEDYRRPHAVPASRGRHARISLTRGAGGGGAADEPAVTDARATTSPARAEEEVAAAAAVEVEAVGEGEGVVAGAAGAAAGAAGAGWAQNGFPRRNSPVAALRRPSA